MSTDLRATLIDADLHRCLSPEQAADRARLLVANWLSAGADEMAKAALDAAVRNPIAAKRYNDQALVLERYARSLTTQPSTKEPQR